MEQKVIADFSNHEIICGNLEYKTLSYLAEGKSFYDTAIKVGLEPKEVIAIYVAHRAKV